jgi:hypothetical protein
LDRNKYANSNKQIPYKDEKSKQHIVPRPQDGKLKKTPYQYKKYKQTTPHYDGSNINRRNQEKKNFKQNLKIREKSLIRIRRKENKQDGRSLIRCNLLDHNPGGLVLCVDFLAKIM